MELAWKMLGRPFEIEGVVVSGQKLGRTIGYPTINIARGIEQVLPPDGVYVGQVGSYRAALSIGHRPAVQGDHRTIEAYLMDYPGDSLYSSAVRLQLLKRLRGEENFPSLEALTQQIDRDVEECRTYQLLSLS
jgi:riboflavin kinase/FMN adenylyltransferase